MTASQSLVRQQAPQQTLAKDGPRELTLPMIAEMTGYTPLQIALISRTVAVDAPLLELAQFLHACKTLQLDPMLRQAYWIRRKNRVKGDDGNWYDEWKGTLQVGIDGFRSLADRQGNYAGSEPPVFRDYKEITFTRYVGTGKDRKQETARLLVPGKAQVTTWKIVQGHKAAFTGEARWDEFYPGQAQGAMWHKMPHHMLAKCAAAQSLRQGWPALLGSLSLNVAEAGDVGEGELPTVAEPSRIVEQPQQPSQAQQAAAYERFIGSNYPDDRTQPTYVQHAPQQAQQADAESDGEVATPEPDASVGPQDAIAGVSESFSQSGPSEALVRNRRLVAEAREAGVKGVGPFTANETWPENKVEDANRELQKRLTARNGDAEIARQAEGIL